MPVLSPLTRAKKGGTRAKKMYYVGVTRAKFYQKKLLTRYQLLTNSLLTQKKG